MPHLLTRERGATDPARREGNQGQPEEQMQIGPEHSTAHPPAGLQQVVMIVPVDPDVQETQHITEENRCQRQQRHHTFPFRALELQHHDRDDDGKHPITESFEAAATHG